MRKLFYLLSFASLSMFLLTTSCSSDDTVEPGAVKSRFTPVQDANDPFTFTFTNESLNAVSYSWDFGDGGTSTLESPSHTYASEGTYTVSMTATGADGSTNTSTQTANVVDPTVELKKLTGETSKTWKLLRDVSGGEYPILVGPEDRSQIWFALGLNQSISVRPCLMEEEYIFSFNGDYEYRPMDDMVWAEEGVWSDDVDGTCVDATVGSNMMNVDGADISAWGAGMFSFDFDVDNAELTLSGSGAHVGSSKVGTDGEFTTPQLSTTYRVVSIETDGPIDKLVLETDLPDVGGYWSFTLVAYDDPNDEPELPSLPEAEFGFAVDGLEVTFTNGSINTTSYSWDFGDGGSSTDEAPVYTFVGDGVYDVTLTATGPNGSDEQTQSVLVCISTDFVLADLHGGSSKTWTLFQGGGALKVGPAQNDGLWFATTAEDLVTRVCTFDDTYTFDNAGNFDYVTNGDVWGEAYMGVDPAGCVATNTLAGGAEAWGDGNHSFSVVDSDGPTHATLTVTGTGAFIGLPKAFNGGEYASPPPVTDGSVEYEVLCYFDNGTDEVMVISVDISGNGSAFWTYALQAAD